MPIPVGNCFEDETPDADVEEVHVYPMFGREHEMSALCWCWPERDEVDPRVIIHNVEN